VRQFRFGLAKLPVNFLHYPVSAGPNDVVEITVDKQANVRLMDDTNFGKYKRGEKHTYYGGLASVSPVRLKPPHDGHWNVVVDLGGYGGSVRASVRVLHHA